MDDLPRTIRAFIALRMDPAVDEAICAFIDRIRNLGAEVSWTKPANLHLTIGRVRSMRNFGPTRCELESSSDLTFGVSHVTSVAIYRSLLSPKGATYELLKAFTFRD